MYTNAVTAYDPVARTYTERAPLPAALQGVQATTDLAGRVHVLGGQQGGSTFVTTHYVYDPAEDVWYTAAPMSTARYQAVGGCASDGRLYVIGGRNPSITGAVEIYDPGTDTWSVGASRPASRLEFNNACAVTHEDQFYVLGGGSVPPTESQVDVYDARADLWREAADLPAPRSGAAAGCVDGTIYLVGGIDNTTNIDSTIAISLREELYLHQYRPVPPLGGAIRVLERSGAALTLGWELLAEPGYQYRVYYAEVADAGDVSAPAAMRATGIPAGPAAADVARAIIPGLAPGSYYFNVLATPPGGAVAESVAYAMIGPIRV